AQAAHHAGAGVVAGPFVDHVAHLEFGAGKFRVDHGHHLNPLMKRRACSRSFASIAAKPKAMISGAMVLVPACLLRSLVIDVIAPCTSPASTYSSARRLHQARCSSRVISE